MRKRMVTSLLMLIAVTVCFIAFAVGSSAMWTGERASERLEFSVPKVNVNNPAIVIDGNVNLDGEWYGALKTGIDLNDQSLKEYYGIWDAGVWGNSMDYPIETYDDIVDKYRMTWDAYWLWDEDGLYFAVVCETDTSYTAYNPDWGFSRIDGFTPIFDATADDGDHTWQWLDFWAATTTGESYWCDDNGTWDSRKEGCPYVIETASYRSITPNAEGKYPWYIEGFLSWDSISYDTNGNRYAAIDGEAGLTIEIGQIFFEGAGEYVPDESGTGWTDRPNYIRANDCPGWNNFNYYTMSAQPAARVYTDAPFAGTGEIVPSEIIVPKVSEPITIDGRFDEDDWGDSFIHIIATSRAEYEHVINPRDTFLDADGGATTANSDWYFRYDDEYLYICAVVTKPYISENINGALWTNVDDMWHLYLGIDDGDDNGINDPHCCFGIVANSDCSETWVNCFEQSMPDAGDTATVNESVRAAIGKSGLSSVYEIAVPIEDALGYSDLDEYDNICFFSGAFFFADDIGGIAYEVGEGVFWADKKPTASPFLIAGPLITEVASGSCGDNATWSLSSDGTLTISGSGAMANYSWASNAPWYSNTPWCSYGENIKKITIENGITSIGEYAFYNCSALISVEIPDSVTSIGDLAFRYCSSLISVEISRSVTSIGGMAFIGCSSLTEFIVASDNPNFSSENGVLFNKDKTTLIQYPACAKLTEYSIPTSVISIGNMAFDGCSSLTSIIIPSGVTSIGSNAFNYCSSLTSIDIPSSVTSFDSMSFLYCTSLKSINVDENNQNYSSKDGVMFNKNKTKLIVCPAGTEMSAYTIPSSVKTVNNFAFDYCISLTSIEIPSSVEYIGQSAFHYCSSLTSIDIPSSVTSFDSMSFLYCTSLKSINVDENNQNYSSQDGVVFNKNKTKLIVCPAGTEMSAYTIPSSVSTIGEYAFYQCSSLSSVNIPNSVENIDWSAFRECTSLTSVKIPSSVTNIGNFTFYDCTSLTSAYFYGDAPTVGTSAFDSNAMLYYIEGKDGWSTPTWNGYRTATFIPDEPEIIANGQCGENAEWTLDENGLLTISGEGATAGYSYQNKAPFYEYREQINSVKVCEGITDIGESLFRDFTFVTSVEIPSTVTRIRFGAFIACKFLPTVYIPSNVSYIENCVFDDCSSLVEIQVDENNVNYCSLNGVLFNKDKTTIVRCPPGINQTEYTIPDTVTVIHDIAFRSCKGLKKITIPESVTNIGDCAFMYCFSLEEIVIPKFVATVGKMAFFNCLCLKKAVFEDNSESVSIGMEAFGDCWDFTAAYFYGNAPTVFGATENRPSFEKDTVTLYYIEGKEGWTSPTWNGYTTATFIPDEPEIIANGQCGENAEWTLDENGLLIISGEGDMYDWIEDNVSPWYSNRGQIEKIIINNGITSIGKYAFDSCTSLISIEIPSSVTCIGEFAFDSCSALESVTFESGSQLETIGRYAFGWCSKLKSINIPATVREIGERAFVDCTALETVTFEDDSELTQIYEGAFLNSGITSITIPASVEAIGYNVFYSCRLLETVEFEENSQLTELGGGVFGLTHSLKSVTIPAGISEIDGGLFSWSSVENINILNSNFVKENGIVYNADKTEIIVAEKNITDIEIPSTVTKINSYAFCYCRKLTDLDFEDNSSLERICNSAFSDCDYLSIAELPASVKYLESEAFSGCDSLKTVTMQGVIGLGEYVFDNCSLLEKIVINNAYYISENGALLNAAKTEIYKYFGSGKEYTVPASVRTIKNGAFWNVSLSRLNFASGSLLETIEMNAINANNVKSLVIPASVTTIKAWGITIYGDTETIYFSGNAPVLEQNAITGNLRWLTIYYQQNSTGWENYSESYNLVAINGVSLDSVYVSNAPNKIKYEDNETVDITGVEITAMYSDGHTQVVTNFDYSPKGQLPEGCDVITFSYTENGTTCTATQGLKHSVVYAGTDETVPNEIRVGISNDIVIDGSFSEEEWGQPAIVAKARSRAENIKMINPRDTFSEAEEDILNADSEWYFKHDSENLYVAIVVDKPLVANTVGKNGTKSLWTDADDTLQLYIGITDDDDNNYNNPHVGFGIAADKDTHQTYVSCFEQSMPGAGDTSMTQESIVAQVGEQDGKTVYEFSMNIFACFGNIVPETGNDIVNFSGAFFFDSDVPGACYQVGSGVLWADKSMNGCPLLVFDGKCGPCGDYAYWSIDDNGTLKISGQGAIDGVESETPQNIYNREESGILASPVQIYNGTKTETTTKGWQQYSNLITKIVIEEGITKIGENAFKGCSEIKSVEVPSTVKRIDEGAFSECSKLETVTLPEKIKTIGDGAFTDCANLESITFQGNVPELNSVGLNSNKVTLMTEEQVTGFTCCVRGDVDGVSGVTRSDAVYISYNINKLEFNQNIDFNGDGKQDEEDALYLMYNLFFPDEYKLK